LQIPGNYNFFVLYPDDGRKGVYKLKIPIRPPEKDYRKYEHHKTKKLLDYLRSITQESDRTFNLHLKNKIKNISSELIEHHGMTEKEIRDYVYPKTDKEVIEKEFSNHVYESPEDNESD
jgi:hypothetical protein